MANIMDFLVADGNTGFLIAGCAVLAVLLLELLATLVGVSFHMFHADVDVGHGSHGEVDGFLGWLNPGKVPVILLFVTFLGCLSIAGYIFNWVWTGLEFEMLSPLFITPIIATLVLPIVSQVSNTLGPFLQEDHSNAISLDDLLGCYGVATLGPIMESVAGQARFKDDHGITHYVDVLAEPGKTIEAGDDVVLLQRFAEDSFMFVVRKAG